MSKKDLCVFYAEDDQDDQQLFRDAIKRIDPSLEFYVQDNGAELMKKLANPPPRPHLIFLDLNMPKKSGIEVLRELQASNKPKDFNVIIFTTSDDEKDIEMTKSLGASIFITKPQIYTDFINAIKYCLSIDWQQFKVADSSFVLSLP